MLGNLEAGGKGGPLLVWEGAQGEALLVAGGEILQTKGGRGEDAPELVEAGLQLGEGAEGLGEGLGLVVALLETGEVMVEAGALLHAGGEDQELEQGPGFGVEEPEAEWRRGRRRT